MLLAVIYGAYREQQLDYYKKEEDTENRILTSAFLVLDVHDCSVITYDVFRLLIKVCEPCTTCVATHEPRVVLALCCACCVVCCVLQRRLPNYHEYQIRASFGIMDRDGGGCPLLCLRPTLSPLSYSLPSNVDLMVPPDGCLHLGEFLCIIDTLCVKIEVKKVSLSAPHMLQPLTLTWDPDLRLSLRNMNERFMFRGYCIP